MAQSDKQPTLDLGSGMISGRGMEPRVGLCAGHGPCLRVLSWPVPLHISAHALKKIKKIKK